MEDGQQALGSYSKRRTFWETRRKVVKGGEVLRTDDAHCG